MLRCVRGLLAGRAGWRHLVLLAAVAALATALSTGVAFWASGGRWFDVTSPSMGTAAPVGTLMLTRPVAVADLRVGDVVAFHPPGRATVTYTHRVVDISGDRVSTRGDVNGALDPWTVRNDDLVGRVGTRLWAVGYLVRALPLLLLGLFSLWGVSRLLAVGLRGPARLLGSALLLSLVAARLKPFVGVTSLVSVSDAGTTRMTMVSTGLLPIRLRAAAGVAQPLDLRSGQTGVLTITSPPPDGRLQVLAGLHMPLGWWVLLGAIWLTPLLCTLLAGLWPVPEESVT